MDARHRYTCVAANHTGEPCHGVTFQSVTTILGKAVPKNLAWHGQTRGVIGVKGLLRRQYDIDGMSADEITEALKRERLTVNDHRDQAAAGGTVVHKALEDYANLGVIPSAADVPESKRGSIRGLAKFILEYSPEFVATEVRTLSTTHAYAGTFDLLCKIKARLDTKPVWAAKGRGATKTDEGTLVLVPDPENTLTALIDLKTSKYVYPSSHFPQLEAYEGARIEAGEEPTDVRAVLWVNAEGDMELVPSVSSFADFLALKASAEVIGRLDRSWKRPRKARS
jgi:hypothetical protein